MKNSDKEEKRYFDKSESEEWFSSGGWLSTSKWFWIFLAVIIIIPIVFKR